MKNKKIIIAHIPSDYSEIDIMLERDIFAAIALLGLILTGSYSVCSYLLEICLGG